MTDHAAFFETIRAYPDDDAPRLVYADYLDEQGDADRAEFIRLQCRLTVGADDESDRKALQLREGELLDAYRVRWWRELPELPGVTWESFERGFVSTVRFENADAYREHAAAVFGSAPILHVRFSGIIARDVPMLTAEDHLRNVLSLDFENGNRIANGGAQGLADCAFLNNLRSLKAPRNSIGPSGVRALADSPHLKNLLELYLDGNDIFADGALALAGDGRERPLRKLSLGWTRIDGGSLGALFRAKTLANLEWLYVSGNPLGIVGLDGVVSSATSANLEALYAEQCHLSSQSIVAAANSVHLRKLKWLYLKHNDFHDLGARAILESPYLQNIRELMLAENPIRDETIRQGLKERFGDRVLI